MNITISVDDRLVERAREVARRQGKSLNTLLRQFLESLVGRPSAEDTATELLDLMSRSPGRSGGRRVHRDEAYEGRA